MDGEVTLGELARLIERNHNETRDDFAEVNKRLDHEAQAVNGRMDRSVRTEVYASDRAALLERIGRVESDAVSYRATTRWAIGLAATSALVVIGMLIQVLSR